jgi:HEPN domain-containing protein
MKRETRAWVRKAEGDWRVANQEAAIADQCAEKYLKAFLQELGLAIPKIHNLEQLLADLFPHDGSLKALKPRFIILSRYAVDYRYPGYSSSTREMHAALRHAERVSTPGSDHPWLAALTKAEQLPLWHARDATKWRQANSSRLCRDLFVRRTREAVVGPCLKVSPGIERYVQRGTSRLAKPGVNVARPT